MPHPLPDLVGGDFTHCPFHIYSMVAIEYIRDKGVCVTLMWLVDCGPLRCHISALMWLSGTRFQEIHLDKQQTYSLLNVVLSV